MLSFMQRPESDARGELKHRSVVVTGGAGFIGSHLCDRLVQKACYVTCIDNLRTGALGNVRPLLNHPNFQFVEHDVTEPLPALGRVDQIYNLACAASPRHYQRDPIGTMRTCVLGACHMLELARRTGARILQASTSEVYGDPEVHPQPESYVGHVNPIGPRACYDEGKRAAETLFADYRRVHGVDVKIARIFNTYGPRMLHDDGRVVSNFVVQALRNEPITIYGDGSQTRSFCFIDDLLVGLELLMESSSDVAGPCNLGNPNEIPVSEIARLIIELTGSRSVIHYRALPQDDPKRRKPVIRTANKVLGWCPRVALEQGLRATIEHFSLALASQSSSAVAAAGPPRPQTRLRTSIASINSQAITHKELESQ
jgi:UDP-glucuronate decarboxylase